MTVTAVPAAAQVVRLGQHHVLRAGPAQAPGQRQPRSGVTRGSAAAGEHDGGVQIGTAGDLRCEAGLLDHPGRGRGLVRARLDAGSVHRRRASRRRQRPPGAARPARPRHRRPWRAARAAAPPAASARSRRWAHTGTFATRMSTRPRSRAGRGAKRSPARPAAERRQVARGRTSTATGSMSTAYSSAPSAAAASAAPIAPDAAAQVDHDGPRARGERRRPADQELGAPARHEHAGSTAMRRPPNSAQPTTCSNGMPRPAGPPSRPARPGSRPRRCSSRRLVLGEDAAGRAQSLDDRRGHACDGSAGRTQRPPEFSPEKRQGRAGPPVDDPARQTRLTTTAGTRSPSAAGTAPRTSGPTAASWAARRTGCCRCGRCRCRSGRTSGRSPCPRRSGSPGWRRPTRPAA